MHQSLKVISLLLSYPTANLAEIVPEIRQALQQDTLIRPVDRETLLRLANDIAELDLYEAQERYVYLFDRTRALSLHLFEHVHGESRDRGQAMVGLMEMYESNGLEVDVKELPDFLPLFLEYLSTRPAEEARELLGQAAHIASALAERLRKRDSIYHLAFEVLCEISMNEPDAKRLHEILSQPEDDPSDLAALDQIWHEESVTFGGKDDEQRVGLGELRAELKSGSRQYQSTPNEVHSQEL